MPVRFEDKPIWTDESIPETGEVVEVLFSVQVLGASHHNGVRCTTVQVEGGALTFSVPDSVVVP